uniref:Uncharacterized protein n=1 Tax=Oryza barthii TaxID=65489 RepID=A0A0D3HAG7_9ORYZ
MSSSHGPPLRMRSGGAYDSGLVGGGRSGQGKGRHLLASRITPRLLAIPFADLATASLPRAAQRRASTDSGAATRAAAPSSRPPRHHRRRLPAARPRRWWRLWASIAPPRQSQLPLPPPCSPAPASPLCHRLRTSSPASPRLPTAVACPKPQRED